MRPLLCLTILVTLAAASGCGERQADAPPPMKEAAAAPAAVEEGMCPEHGVLEALCTKCNPKLAALFQAKGDWCAEHGFPESICPTCHPERGGKPAVDVAMDDAPPDGTKVVLKTEEAARLAGIETVKAVAGGGRSSIVAPAVFAWDASRVAQVGARSAGVVRRLAVEVGTPVSAGATLAVIESPAVGGDQARLAAARSRVQITEANWKREAELEKKGISAKIEALAAEQEHREALAELEALQAALAGAGADGGGGRATVKAPITGVVTQRATAVNAWVQAGEPLFEIVDTSVMWAEVAVPERHLGLVQAGVPVVVTVDGLEGREFRGTIATIAPMIDPQTRTAKARVRLANPDGALRANMYGEARIPVAGEHGSARIPRDAVQRAKSARLAFVRLADTEYEARRVEVTAPDGDGFVEVASGIEPGEEVVVAGSFFLKTETLRDSLGSGCCEVAHDGK